MEEKNTMQQDVNQDVENKDIVDTPENTTQDNKKAYTQDELNSIIKSNVDRAVAKARQEAEEEKEEAKKLAKMNAEQKAQYETQKALDELAKREAEVTKRELTAEAKSILTERGLSIELHSLLNYESAETVNESINTLESAIQKVVEAKVQERLKGNAPKKTTGSSGLTKEEILSISNPVERQKMIAQNLDLFN